MTFIITLNHEKIPDIAPNVKKNIETGVGLNESDKIIAQIPDQVPNKATFTKLIVKPNKNDACTSRGFSDALSVSSHTSFNTNTVKE